MAENPDTAPAAAGPGPRSADLSAALAVAGPAVNLVLLDALAARPHPLLHIPADTLPNAVAAALRETRTAHHLLDLIDTPFGGGSRGGSRDASARDARIDARVYLAMRKIQEQGERLSRIADWHSRESGPSGTFGTFCNECGNPWPCDTRRLAGNPDLLHLLG